MKRNKFFYGTVVGLFDVVGKKTGRQLVLAPVVSHALAADPFAGTRVIGAIAVLLVGFGMTFHRCRYLRCQKRIGAWCFYQVPISLAFLFQKGIGAAGFEPAVSTSRT